jgi:primosomal protein N'
MPSFPLARALPDVEALAIACAADDADAACRAALPLLGLGPGLTPSGDDLVGAAFFARRALARSASGAVRWSRAGERLAQTIVQVAGRAGRAEKPGEVLIQTEYPEHRLLQLLLEGGYEAFAAGALQEREQSEWPPFARIALLRAEAATALAPMKFLRAALAVARDFPMRGVQLLGPAPAPMERRAGRYRAQVLLHAATHSPLQKFMSAWLPALESLPEARRVRWSIDVDALDLA